jgi:hypothetical protein
LPPAIRARVGKKSTIATGFVVDAQVARRLAFLRLTNVVYISQGHARIAGPVDDVGRFDAEPLLEALTRRQARLSRAEVPFPEHRRAIAGVAQHLRERDLPGVQPARRAGGDCFPDAGADGQTSGHQRGAARRALVLAVEVRQPHALRGELVDARGRRVQDAPVVARRHSVPDVVGEHEQDVGFGRGVGLRREREPGDQYAGGDQRSDQPC